MATSDPIIAFSDQTADLVARTAKSVVAVHGAGRPHSGIIWRPGVVVTAEEALEGDDKPVVLIDVLDDETLAAAGQLVWERRGELALLRALGFRLSSGMDHRPSVALAMAFGVVLLRAIYFQQTARNQFRARLLRIAHAGGVEALRARGGGACVGAGEGARVRVATGGP